MLDHRQLLYFKQCPTCGYSEPIDGPMSKEMLANPPKGLFARRNISHNIDLIPQEIAEESPGGCQGCDPSQEQHSAFQSAETSDPK
jgi:hypothetical protein